MPVQQEEELFSEAELAALPELPELEDIDRVKELFEYEMTQVLLNFKSEISEIKSRTNSEYLNMELPKASVDFEAPEVAVKGIDYSESGMIGGFETPEMAVSAPVVNIGAVPEVKAVSVKLEKTESVKDAEKHIEAVAVPDVRMKFEKPVLKAADSIDAPAVPEIGFGTALGEAADVSAPELGIVGTGSIAINTSFEVKQAAAPEICIPETSLDASAFELPALSGTGETASVKIPETKQFEMPVFSQIAVPDKLVSDKSFAPVGVNAFSGFGGIEVTEVKLGVTEAAKPAEFRLLTEKPVFRPEIKLSVPEAIKPEIPTMPELAAMKQPEYPEIPEAPDFSAYYADIFETLKAEM